MTVCLTFPNCSKSLIRPSFELIDSFRIYLGKADQWINLIQKPDDRFSFSAYPFRKNIFVFGGYIGNSLKNSYKYDTKRSKWKVSAKMNACRENAACTGFKGKIVLTGGYDGEENFENLKFKFSRGIWLLRE